MMQPQFRTKDAQRRGAMITRSVAAMLSVFTERARSRSKRAGTKVGTARCAQFSAITVDAAAGEGRNRVLVTSLEGLRAFNRLNASSDKSDSFCAFDSKQQIGAVRITAAHHHSPIFLKGTRQLAPYSPCVRGDRKSPLPKKTPGPCDRTGRQTVLECSIKIRAMLAQHKPNRMPA